MVDAEARSDQKRILSQWKEEEKQHGLPSLPAGFPRFSQPPIIFCDKILFWLDPCAEDLLFIGHTLEFRVEGEMLRERDEELRMEKGGGRKEKEKGFDIHSPLQKGKSWAY